MASDAWRPLVRPLSNFRQDWTAKLFKTSYASRQ
jgi:hypothetical protein